jgi:hypothetical protein
VTRIGFRSHEWCGCGRRRWGRACSGWSRGRRVARSRSHGLWRRPGGGRTQLSPRVTQVGLRSHRHHCTGCGLTSWAHNLTTYLCSGHGQIARMCGQTVSRGQQWISKSLVRRGEAVKGKTASSKTTCQETTMLLVERSSDR